MSTHAETLANLTQYKEQLQQVEELLAVDPTSEQFLGLKTSLVEAITLTEEIVRVNVAVPVLGAAALTGSEYEKPSFSAVAANAEGPKAGFAVGDTCQAFFKSESRWFDAVVVEVLLGGRFRVKYLGYEAEFEEVKKEHIRERLDGALFAPGSVCDALYEDGKWYRATVESVTPHKTFVVAFNKFKDTRQTCKSSQIMSLNATALDKSMKRPMVADKEKEIPDSLRFDAADSEEVRLAKRKKVHAIKSSNRLLAKDTERKEKQSSWQTFQTKGKKGGFGVKKGKSKESMFRSPVSVDGKVGVVGSGNKVTENAERVLMHNNRELAPVKSLPTVHDII